MPIPLTLSVPAAVAGLAYLNVKTGFWYDRTLLRATFPALYRSIRRDRSDRCSTFYALEEKATNKSSRDQPYIIFQDKSWTFHQVYEIALKYGNWLKIQFDVKPKDIVAIDLQNSDHYVFICFGLWSIGAKPAFINYNLTGHALIHCVTTAEPVLMLVDPEIAAKVDDGVREKLEHLRIEILTDEVKAQVLSTEPIRPPDSLRSGQVSKDMAILIYTSGTTGLPKAAIVSWKKLTTVGIFAGSWLATKPSDVFYTCMPLYHSSATIMGMAHCLETGCALALGKKFSTKTFWKEARQYNATLIQYVGETCRYLLAAPPEINPFTGENMDKKHNVRIAFGNGLRPDIWNKFKDRFGIDGIAEFYGATEGSMALFNYTRNELGSGGIGHVGLLYSIFAMVSSAIIELDPETDAPVRDPKTGFCRRVRRGDVGELLFKLPGEPEDNFQGYYNDRASTESKIMRDVLQKGDHYFRSGDLVSWDRQGIMRFHDRMGDTFRWKSENVATTEVSEALGAHDAVQEANVYGVQLPNHDGRAGCAAIKFAQEQPNDMLLQSLADHVRSKLPKYAVPLFLRVGRGISTAVTDTNKQKKNELRVQGVNPTLVGGDELYWLKDTTYVKFSKSDWDRLNAGQVKL
ncbi:acetyl-CoA synthetase-like protein [Jackrogersella minutella]|nr:acetyl-CoA synthetase-like protein [Jackrogersella minutella]